jgi:hypothetical protein
MTSNISSCVVYPSIQFSRELYFSDSDCFVIKLAIKKGKKLECRIPFKSLSESSLILEPEFIDSPQQNSFNLEAFIYPSFVNVLGKG